MAQEQNVTLPAGYSVITNATVKEVRANQYNGFDLIAETISPLVGTKVEQRVPLYTTDFQTHQVSQDVIEGTQANLRRVLGDDNITFHETPDETDPNDIVNWAAAHVGAPISALYVHEGKVRIAAPRANNGDSPRQSFWLKKYSEDMGAYNPDENYLSFFDAQTEADQKAIEDLNTKVLAQSSFKGHTSITFFGEGTIQNVIYSSAVPYNARAAAKDLTAHEVIDLLVAVLSQDAPEVLVPKASVDADKALAVKLLDLKNNDKNGLYAIYSVLGGVNYLNNVSEERRDTVKQFLNTVSIDIVTMYIRTKANKVFQLSTNPMRRLDVSRSQTHGLHIEFLKNDFKSNDILLPLVDGNVIDEAEALRIAKDNGYVNAETGLVELADMAQGMEYLRQLFNGKTVRYRSVVADDRAKTGTIAKTEKRMMSSNFISAKPADDAQPAEAVGAKDAAPEVEPEPIKVIAAKTDVPSSDFNPFDVAPAAEEEPKAAEPVEDGSAIGSNPFAI